jgi:heme oxygenase
MTDSHDSIMQRLKTETRDLHSHAESRVLQRQIASGEIERDAFVAYLGQLYFVHRALETALEESRGANSAINSIATADRMRIADLDRDLSFHGQDPDDLEANEAASRFMARIDETKTTMPVALLGALYVLEGSTNGGRFLARALRKSWNLDAEGLAYFDPYGDEQPQRWAAFRRDMDGSSFDAAQHQAIVEMAKATFVAISAVSDEVANHDS